MRTLLAILFLASCAAPPETQPEQAAPALVSPETDEAPSPLTANIAIDFEFSVDEVGAILEAAYFWQHATEGRAALTFHIRNVEPGEPQSIARAESVPGGDTLAGFTNVETQSISLAYSTIFQGAERVDLDYGTLFRLTALHELGHALGVGHVDSTECVMTSGNGLKVAEANIWHLQPCDIEAFNAAWPVTIQ